jgi:tetratricopeptide (TPR) repeat protein
MQFYVVGSCMLSVLLGLLLVSGSGQTPAQTDCTTALQDYQVALRSYEDGLFGPAIASFEAYLRQCPETTQALSAHYFLGEILYKRDRFADALRHATQVVSRAAEPPLQQHALLLAAQALLQLGQPDKAQVYLQRVLASRSSGGVRPAVLYWLGEIAFQHQRYAEARTYYTRLLKEQPSGPYTAQAQYSLGWVCRQLGDTAAALQAFAAFVALTPEHEFAPQARFARAALLRETKQLIAAAEVLKQLAQDAPASLQDEVLFWWAETAYELGRYAEALTAYERLVTAHPQSTRVNASLYGWGWAAVQQGQCATAVHPWEMLLQREPTSSQTLDVHYQLGLCYLQLQQNAAAQRHLQQAVALGTGTPQHADVLLKLATLAFQQGEYAEAVQYYTQALPTVPPEDIFRIYYLVGESYAALGQQIQALEHWRQVLAGPPTLPWRAQALHRLGSTYIAQNDWQQAIPVLRQLWEEFPQFAARTTVAAQLAQAYNNTQQCAEALSFYDMFIATASETRQRSAAVGAKAWCLFTLERYADVVQLLAPIVSDALATVEPEVLYALGQAYIQQQQYHAALAPFVALRQRFPDHALTRHAERPLAVAFEQAGQREEALVVWRTYLQHDIGQGDAERARLHLHVGRLAFKVGQWGAALDFLAPVRQASSATLAAEALFWSGEVYFQQQQWDLALQVYQELIDRYAAEEEHWGALARLRLGTIYEQQQEWERALQVYKALLTATLEAELLTHVRRRITAIEAGQALTPQPPVAPRSKG